MGDFNAQLGKEKKLRKSRDYLINGSVIKIVKRLVELYTNFTR